MSTQAVTSLAFYCTDTTQGGTLVLGHGRDLQRVFCKMMTLGDIRFAGADGTDLQLKVQESQHRGRHAWSNDMPTRLVFETCSDGQSSPTERPV